MHPDHSALLCAIASALPTSKVMGATAPTWRCIAAQCKPGATVLIRQAVLCGHVRAQRLPSTFSAPNTAVMFWA
jgi:hypothetical protein